MQKTNINEMETLLLEIVEEIAAYLPTKDLLACCAVSQRSRDLFGSDVVWRRRCDPTLEEYLRTTPCRVEPEFTSPEDEDSTLSPLGRWRLAYMREQHLRRNCAQGKFVKEETNPSLRGSGAFFDNDFLVATTSNSVQLLNTNVQPLACVSQIDITYHTFCVVSIIQSDKFLVRDNKNKIQIIQVNWEDFSMTIVNVFDAGDIDTCHVFNTVGLFVGIDDKSIRLWNLNDGINITNIPVMDGIEDVAFNYNYEKCTTLGVVGIKRSSYLRTQKLILFCLEDHEFLPFETTGRRTYYNCAVMNGYIAAIFHLHEERGNHTLNHSPSSSPFVLEIYNSQTSRCIRRFDLTFFNSIIVSAIGSSFLFLSSDLRVLKFNPATEMIKYLESGVRSLISLTRHLYLTCNITGQYKILKLKPNSDVAVVFPPHLEQQYLAERLVSYTAEDIEVNRFCTKLSVCKDTVNPILHTFW